MLIPARQYDWTTLALLSKPRRLFAALAVVIATAAGVAVWFAAGGGSSAAAQPKDDPVVFLRGVVRGIVANDYEGVWPSLHPAQQRVATREAYVRCERLSPVNGHLDWIKVLRAVDERISVAGGDEELVDSKAVTFELKLSRPSAAAFAVTVHAVAVDGHWRWILTPRRFQIYRSGTCPKAEESPASSA